EKFGIPREDVAPKAAPKNVDKRSTPPPPARVTCSKKKTAKAEEEPPSHNVEGKNRARKPSKAPQQPKASGSRAAPVVVSSDSETSGSGTDGTSSLSAESAASLKAAPKHLDASRPSIEPTSRRPKASRALGAAPPQSLDASGASNETPSSNKAPASSLKEASPAHPVHSNSRGSTIAPPQRSKSSEPAATSRRSSAAPPLRSNSSMPASKKAPCPFSFSPTSFSPASSAADGKRLNANLANFVELPPAAPGPVPSIRPSPSPSASKRSSDGMAAHPSSPPKKQRLSPIPERLAVADVAAQIRPASTAPPAAPPVGPLAPVPSTAPTVPAFAMGQMSREQGFFVPPGMMVDPTYFGGGGFIRFGGDFPSMEGRTGGFGFQMNPSLFSSIPGTF
ncbi:hypothetical protein H0H92_007794, partial [Tricholoma furcatifolium]